MVRLLVVPNSAEQPAYEWVPARPVGSAEWELLGTPGLTMGAAAGDRLLVRDDGSFEVVERSGNVGVWVFGPMSELDRIGGLTARFEALGGRLDGGKETRAGTSFLRIFTVPVKAGLLAIEAAARSFTESVPGTSWYYVNIYDPADEVTPLNWWLD